MEVTWLQLVTLVIALIGAVLGVLTTWRTFNQDRLRVLVKPTTVYLPNVDARCLGVEVVNLSASALTVTSIGFTKTGRTNHMQLMAPHLSSGDRLPKRMEPRTAFTAFAAVGATEEAVFADADRAYVGTACGNRVTSTRRQLRTVVENLRRTRTQ